MSTPPTLECPQQVEVEVGRRQRFDLGRRGRRPVVLCIDRCVVLPQGAFVSGWLADPWQADAGLRLEIGGSEIDPLSEGHASPRPDVVASLRAELGKRLGDLDDASRVGFARFFACPGEVPGKIGVRLDLGDDGLHRFRVDVASDTESVFAFARSTTWGALAPHLPDRAEQLPIAWRDSLLRLVWLAGDDTREAAEIRGYLEGEPRKSPAAPVRDTATPEADTLPAPAAEPESRVASAIEPAEDDEVIEAIRATGLFDSRHYVDAHPDAGNQGLDPLTHFCKLGWRRGWTPNPYFDTSWYLRTNPDVAEAGYNPLWHYVVIGEAEGRWPNPLFEPDFFRAARSLGEEASPLRAFLQSVEVGEPADPVELFDAALYLEQNPDVRDAGEEPSLHYLRAGHLEGRDPSASFHTSYYRAKYLQSEPEVNPLAHFYEVGRHHGHHTEPGPHDLEEGIAAQVRRWVNPGEGYEELDPAIAAGRKRKAKALAFYLPQFHAIPENDEWWGRGFTEWRNVMRGLPRFAGHFQPRIPRDLGFYDLSNPEVIREQTELARHAGVHGFCFHYYWFNGRRLLERPLDEFLADASIDFPFCVAWANENWTRRWDGMESEVLLRQEYDPDDDEALVDDLQRYFADPRYVRIDDRPLLFLYRVDIVPQAREAFERWRKLWEFRHGERPLIFLAQTFGVKDPRDYGLDGAVEFPPHKLTQDRSTDNHEVRVLDPTFRSQVFNYDSIARDALAEPHPDYPLIKTAVPSWDNDARVQGAGGLVLRDATPERYEEWLRGLVDYAERHPVFGERIVCVNAWNEWAEAAYLEPDVHYGSAYLNATARAICRAPEVGRPPTTVAPSPAAAAQKLKVLMVGHDAHPFGAQHNLRQMARTIRNQFGCEVAFVLRAGGDLIDAYRELGEVYVTDDDPEATHAAVAALAAEGYGLALANTTATGSVVPYLKDAGFRVVSLIHELPRLIEEYGLGEALERIAERSDKIVFAAETVRDGFCAGTTIPPEKLVVRPQGLYRPVAPVEGARERVRAELGIPLDARIVLNAGSGDARKGIDIFLNVAKQAAGSNLHFVWAGKLAADAERWLQADLSGDLAERVHLLGYTADVDSLFRAADVFLLSSREDPFPSVVLEAMAAGLPVVAFEGSGGIVDLVARHGVVLDRNDLDAILVAVDELSAPGGDPDAAKEERKHTIREEFRWDDYCFFLLELLDPSLKRISVAVPSYNYRDYLSERLGSIFSQGYPVFEVIALDDRSTDGSLEELERLAANSEREFRIVPNERNSGSAFLQWAKACDLACGDYLWIAEADDSSRPGFLGALAARLGDDVAFAFSDSAQVDETGAPSGTSYNEYYRQAVGYTMDADVELEGKEFVRTCLAERNLVLNVSAVVWNRACLAETLERSVEELVDYKLAGDWHLYVAAALSGRRVAYLAQPLNVHRRHEVGVTGSLDKQRHLDEIARVHEHIANWLGAEAGVRDRMEAYREELERQFGPDKG